MQALGAKGPLLKRAVQDVISQIREGQKLTILTNDDIYQSSATKNIKNKLLNLNYSSNQLSLNNVILKATSLFSKSKTSLKTIVVISAKGTRTTSMSVFVMAKCLLSCFWKSEITTIFFKLVLDLENNDVAFKITLFKLN